jgi:hypothetical protein
MALTFLVSSAFVRSPGVDVTGPIHDSELMFPLVILVALGLERVESWEHARVDDSGRPSTSFTRWAGIASIVICYVLYAPPRLATLTHMGAGIKSPFDQLESEGIHDAVVFSPRPFIPPCATAPARAWVLWRPLPLPDLSDDVIWVNHIDISLDRRFRALLFPDRDAFVMAWSSECLPVFLPLELDVELPAGVIGGSGEVADLVAEIERAESAGGSARELGSDR